MHEEKEKSLSPMAFAAKVFATVCDEVDNTVTPSIPEQLKRLFADAHEELTYRVDKRICLDRWIKEQKEAVIRAADYYQAQLGHLNLLHEAFKAQTQADIESVPGIEFRGKLGKIWVQANPPALELSFGGKTISPEVIQMFGVPDEYVRVTTTTTYSIDTERVKAELKAGKTFEWASLRESRGVRFPAIRKPKPTRIQPGVEP